MPRSRGVPLVATLTVGIPLIGLAAAVVDAFSHGVETSSLVLLSTMYTVCAFGTEIGFHRLLSHRAFRATPAVKVVFAVLGSMAAQGPPLFWASVHRRHHAKADRDGDPHSPRSKTASGEATLRSFLGGHMGWLFTGRRIDGPTNVSDLLRDRSLLAVHRTYPVWIALGVVVPAFVGWLASGGPGGVLRGALWGGLVRIALWQQVTWSVNSFGHVFGSRPFATQDRSTNNAWLAPATLGGSWHNNHHAFPSSAKVGIDGVQLDGHYVLIRLLELTGLVTDVKVPTAAQISRKRNS